jgi:hypothetical protein
LGGRLQVHGDSQHMIWLTGGGLAVGIVGRPAGSPLGWPANGPADRGLCGHADGALGWPANGPADRGLCGHADGGQ